MLGDFSFSRDVLDGMAIYKKIIQKTSYKVNIKCLRTNTPAHKNEDDEFRPQKWNRNFSRDLSRETAVCELRGESRQGQKNVHRVRELRTP